MTTALQWPLPPEQVHGGPDAGAPVRWDFSTNANPLGPLAPVAHAVQAADRTRYPDPAYAALCEQVARWHGVAPWQVVPAASAGEWIWRFTQVLRLAGGARRVWVPQPAYAEYAAAAAALGAACMRYPLAGPPPALQPGDLLWLCEPHNPCGTTLGPALPDWIAHARACQAHTVLDLAYAPLRDDGFVLPAAASQCWQLWSPNKASGLTGVRGAYAVAPCDAELAAQSLRRHAPAWVLGAEGVAMIGAFCSAPAEQLLGEQRRQLHAGWGALRSALLQRGWRMGPGAHGVAPFLLAHPPGSGALAPLWHAAWRQHGLKLRDAASFGLPGWVRLAALPAAAQDTLLLVCDALHGLPTP
ncbi:aminotransferase class I/II-fold pyridoxal phosphate-dependent enzyme [Ideonella sp. BN130291]|uniref:aminotransferase class I/II-fold pyridoxal phosphate-dependent enzyme n=1 Tax=Ideonella sp. BN130291 TaxID=3112940 RepID=UPI002E259789|nr:aminotransferase class I/II-fold pyridoxal phosphate-dependent enzyme [Ideonella sp. BN130291]